MPITFEIAHTWVSIQNTNPHDVFIDNHKYFTFVSHICSHLWFLTYSLFGSHFYFFSNAYEVCTAIHKCSTFGSHIPSFTSMTMYVFLVWETCLFSFFTSITFETVIMCTNTQYKCLLSVKWQSNIVICQPYLFFHMYEHLHRFERHITRSFILYVCMYVHSYRQIDTYIYIYIDMTL